MNIYIRYILLFVLSYNFINADTLYQKYEKMSPEYIKMDLIDKFDRLKIVDDIEQSFNKKNLLISLTFSFPKQELTKQLIAMDRIERNICMSPRSKLLLTKGFKYLIKHKDINKEINYLKILNKSYCQIHFNITY